MDCVDCVVNVSASRFAALWPEHLKRNRKRSKVLSARFVLSARHTTFLEVVNECIIMCHMHQKQTFCNIIPSELRSPATKTILFDDKKKQPLAKTYESNRNIIENAVCPSQFLWSLYCPIFLELRHSCCEHVQQSGLPHNLPPRGSAHSKSILSRFRTNAWGFNCATTNIEQPRLHRVEAFRIPIQTNIPCMYIWARCPVSQSTPPTPHGMVPQAH